MSTLSNKRNDRTRIAGCKVTAQTRPSIHIINDYHVLWEVAFRRALEGFRNIIITLELRKLVASSAYQRHYFSAHIGQFVGGHRALLRGFPTAPVQTLHLIGQHGARRCAPCRVITVNRSKALRRSPLIQSGALFAP